MYWEDQLPKGQLLVDGRFVYEGSDGFSMRLVSLEGSDVLKLATEVPGDERFINLKTEHLDALEHLIAQVRELKRL